MQALIVSFPPLENYMKRSKIHAQPFQHGTQPLHTPAQALGHPMFPINAHT